jgi:hypothetical protein
MHRLLFLATLLVIVLVIFRYRTPPTKTIWLLWLQGWDKAPWYIHKVKDSWVKHNPGWNVELVSADTVNIKIPGGASPAAASDIIRLNLLARHGGVWADATMLCMRPLDTWVHDAIRPTGFWMYHGEVDGPDSPASWFIISKKNNYLITKWRDECNLYWKKNSKAHTYRWMDELFMKLIETDPECRRIWRGTPYLNCEAPGQAHMLAGKTLGSDPELKEILRSRPPYAVKLSRHGAPDQITDEFKETNMYYALMI